MAASRTETAGRASGSMGIPAVSVAERVHAERAVLLWQARGASTCILDGTTRRLLAGHGLWIPAGTVHAIDVDADSVVLPLHLDPRLQPVGVLAEPTWVAVDGELRTVILALLQMQNSIIRPDVDLERRLIRMLRDRTVPPTGLPMPSTDYARAIAERLRDEPADGRSIAELAAEHHVSPRTVERVFIAETGMSPQHWRGRRRMEIAAAMLSGRKALGSVAPAVGYRSPSAFRRAFKRQYGIVPSEYARRHGIPR
ncbi:helix-turn-helix domain-containing protein [Microbacterium tumbae]